MGAQGAKPLFDVVSPLNAEIAVLSQLIHDVAHGLNADAMGQSRLARFEIPRLMEDVGDRGPEEIEVLQDARDVAGAVVAAESVERAVVEAVLDHLEDAVVLDVAVRLRRRRDASSKWVP